MSQWSNRYSVFGNIEIPPHSEPEIMSPPPEPYPSKVYVRSTTAKLSTHLKVQLRTLDTQVQLELDALLDSGATGMFINTEYVRAHNLNTRKLLRPVPVYNVDGTLNQGGSIKEELDITLKFQDHTERATFAVCDLGHKAAIIGHSWLFWHNPEINWQTGEVVFSRCPQHCHLEKKKLKAKKKKQQRFTGGIPPLAEEEDIQDEDSMDVSEIFATQTMSQKLAEQHQMTQEKKSFEDLVPPHYHKFRDIFSKESFDELPARKPWDHAIELKPGSEPQSCKLYPLSPNEQAELDKFLKEHMESGRIRPSKSPMASPFFFIKKKDGSLRPVQDYRKLNSMTIKNSYPLPLIADIINKLSGAKYFTKLDVRWGYNNVRIREGDEWKAAFRTNRGLFEPLVMFFGLTNSPATFQTMMNDIFKELIDEGVVIVYMDDILVLTATLEKHREVVEKVLEILRTQKLYLKPEKCEFEKSQIEYLGLIISPGQVAMDPVKVEGVMAWPQPKDLREVQSFVGFVNFYRRFIQGFSEIARPLYELSQKNVTWKWGPAQTMAFEEIKKRITTAPCLVFPDQHQPYKIEADSSDYATGAVLSQLSEDDKWHPVAFLSKSLSAVERNYEIHDKEMLAIIRALEEWRHYLEGAEHPVQIWTDHKNLEYFMTAKKLNRRQARWSLFLSRFDFSLHHRPGKKSLKPDALSRRPDHGKGENDNDNIVLLKPEFFRISALRQGHALLVGQETALLKKIREAKDLDENVVKAVEELDKSPARRLDGQEWSREQGLILFRGKVYVPKDMELRRQIVEAHHDSMVAGHPGRWKTLELVSRNYWWPGISRYVASYVQGCDRCNRTKTFPAKPSGYLTPNPVPKDVWEVICVDLITGLPVSQGYDSIMVVIDRFTKMLHAIPTTETVTSEGIARLFRDHVWKLHGLPQQVISDRGPQFVSGCMKALYQLLDIKGTPSTAFHPQTDGQTERANQEIEQFLRLFVNHRQDDWVEWLAMAEFSYNNRIQASTRQTPFMLNTGRHPRMGSEPFKHSTNESVDQFAQRMQATRKEAEAALHQAADDMARYYNQGRQEAVSYKVGDKVWLDGKNIQTSRPCKKLDDKRYGPFKITKVISPSAYQLALPKTMRVHPVFHTIKLSPVAEDTISGRPAPSRPGPIIVEATPEFEVEYIKDSRLWRGKLQYLVKWKGYPQEESTWEPLDNVKNAPQLIKDFHSRHPSAPRKISALTFSRLPFRAYENLTEPAPSQHLYDWTQGKHIEGNVP